MIMLMRGIPEKNTKAHNGVWKKSAINSYEVRGKTLGIIGYGHIGSQVSVLAESLGINVLFYDIEEKLALGNALQVNSLDQLLKQSDMVSLHVPANKQTTNMINASSFLVMKQCSILINASRGNVVDITALNNALESNKILGAAIDVFPEEPKSNKDKFSSILTKHDNVILTPHIGGSTLEAQKNIGLEVSKKLIKYSDNGSTTSSINFPDVSLPILHTSSCRILHIHHNKTGVMKEINNIISENNINIVGLYLQTNESIGYVVMDIETSQEHAQKLLNQFKEIPKTIRSRALF
jgi:D-3-phosphoglycerate dehydrogenase / 2-oxoglutarate reductase